MNPNFDMTELVRIGAESSNAPMINNFLSIFMHGNVMHLLSNMTCLWFLFDISYQRIGIILSDIVFIVTGFSANVISQVMSPETIAVGASGAILGIAGMLLVTEWYYCMKGSYNVFGWVLGFAIYNVIFTFMSVKTNDYAHIGGLVAGIVIGIVFTIFIFFRNLLTRR